MGTFGTLIHSDLDHLLPPIVRIRYCPVWLGRLHSWERRWTLGNLNWVGIAILNYICLLSFIFVHKVFESRSDLLFYIYAVEQRLLYWIDRSYIWKSWTPLVAWKQSRNISLGLRFSWFSLSPAFARTDRALIGQSPKSDSLLGAFLLVELLPSQMRCKYGRSAGKSLALTARMFTHLVGKGGSRTRGQTRGWSGELSFSVWQLKLISCHESEDRLKTKKDL